LSESKILQREEAARRAAEERESERQIVFTNGCFDLLHVGHIHSLYYARSLGDVLFVAINSDASVRRIKGSQRPLIPQKERAILLAALECVDVVILFEEDTPLRLIQEIRPHVLAKGSQYDTHEIVGSQEMMEWGGIVKRIPMLPGRSTTELIRRIQGMEIGYD